MFYRRSRRIAAAALVAGVALLTTAAQVYADEARLEKGKQLAFERTKGNCLACHAIADGSLAGTIGPPLLMMEARFPNKADLRAQIWDATVKNPNSMMPPFGRHRILTDDELDLIVDYIYSL